ncbi:hypothetical protein EJB05_03691 [Eragrostis curvula]|uniref:DUF547 domain-containing protein n=1 Tax=Eragrostis curvula TaxID=38414 RepID=A0A5J9W8J6_9POAL|nr:hypothetical protein EJB05_03691 [Eragrostis curvula]
MEKKKQSQRTRGSSVMRQQRRLALEQEVAELKQQLSNEETVHHILERALHQPNSVVLNRIPAFIPGKAKELLAELLLVEQEIARLEAQIHQMKGGLAAMRQQPKQQEVPAAAPNTPSPASSKDDTIKSMFFITQAMDGEYLNKVKSPKQDKLIRNAAAGMLLSPSNKHILHNNNNNNRHSLDNNNKPPAAANKMVTQQATAELPIMMKTATSSTNNKMILQQPNKLSERIVKCLVCIFIRLLRSSRVAELADKQSSSGSNGSFSFRIDTGLLINVDKQERRGQQDHYGIFAIQDAIVRDIGPYKNLVRFTSSSFDLRGFSTSPLLTKLRGMLEALQQVDLRYLSHQQKLAFWLNIYNTCIMHGILQHGLPSNSEKLLALKNKATINVSGQKFNALVIENFILRQPSSVKEVGDISRHNHYCLWVNNATTQEFWKCDVDVEEQEVRGLYGLSTSEPNILFALCCGIRSSPALRIYKADRVLVDLDKAKLEYLQASLVVTSTRRLMIPSLIHSNMHDFAKDMESLVRWICEQLPTSWSLRKSMVDCLRGQAHCKVDDVVDVIPFDYEFQYLLPM